MADDKVNWKSQTNPACRRFRIIVAQELLRDGGLIRTENHFSGVGLWLKTPSSPNLTICRQVTPIALSVYASHCTPRTGCSQHMCSSCSWKLVVVDEVLVVLLISTNE
ncbi:hypothetical protein LOAG_09913 [Loa loa]|uniref:Uncharacterized protein n=1 Tax=Loa loa TaxID=7209 RepID=A0A1S0TQT7_LOALO|nr:hypothetical protein LOAG_09913 [Loa loa]EFO18582.1 hypothetical protein LOAG_09913 [Loa loa]